MTKVSLFFEQKLLHEEDSSLKKHRQLKVMRSRLSTNGGREMSQILVWREQKAEQQWSNLGFKSRSQDLGACILTAMDRNQSKNSPPQPVGDRKAMAARKIKFKRLIDT